MKLETETLYRKEIFYNKMNQDLVSIIVPVYNKEKYIERCLESIMKQTYKEIELIIIDDGSSDNSSVIIEKTCKLYSNIKTKVYSQENKGRSEARNKGIGMSSGSYIVMVDADDTINPYMIEKLHNNIITNNSDCSVCGMEIVGDKTRKVCMNDNVNIETDLAFIKKFIATNGAKLGTSSCNKMYKSSIIKGNNIRYPKYDVGEDYFFCIEYALCSRKWSCVNEALYTYYQLADSTMHNNDISLIKQLYLINDMLIEFAVKNNLCSQLESSISTSCIKLIFREASIISNCKGIKQKKKKYRVLVNDEEKKKLLSKADTVDMEKKYAIFYKLYKGKHVMLIYIMMELYKMYIGSSN